MTERFSFCSSWVGLACFSEKIYNSASKPKYYSSEDKKNGLYNNLSW